jgi:hypothetical protein
VIIDGDALRYIRTGAVKINNINHDIFISKKNVEMIDIITNISQSYLA